MSKEIPFLCVPSRLGELVRQRLLGLSLFDASHRILSEQGLLFFPLKCPIDLTETFPDLSISEFTTGKRAFPEVLDTPKILPDVFKGKMTDEEVALLPRAYDLIGDIAVLEIPEEIATYRHDIGLAFLKIHPNFVTVLGKKSAISGTLRLREYELLAGVDKTDTIHTEYGCRIAVDLSKAYFSPRLLEEHKKVAQQVRTDEHVVDMFTGVGPFALHIAKDTKAIVTAVDINPGAIVLLQQSMSLNRLVGTIKPVVSDIREFVQSSGPQTIDRVIMNHPSGASSFINEACRLLRTGGIMHYYDFIGGTDPEQALLAKLEPLVEGAGRQIKEILRIRRVRDSAPYEYHMVIDALIE